MGPGRHQVGLAAVSFSGRVDGPVAVPDAQAPRPVATGVAAVETSAVGAPARGADVAADGRVLVAPAGRRGPVVAAVVGASVVASRPSAAADVVVAPGVPETVALVLGVGLRVRAAAAPPEGLQARPLAGRPAKVGDGRVARPVAASAVETVPPNRPVFP